MIRNQMSDDSGIEEIGDLDSERLVYYTTGGAAPVYHLTEECDRLQQNDRGYREVAAKTVWDDQPVCKSCTDSIDKYRPKGKSDIFDQFDLDG
jgi:hypothetical protein